MAAAFREQSHVVPSNSCNKRSRIVPQIPDDVIETILSYLPLKEVSRLAILSKRFRHSWKFCRDLSFDRNFATNMSRDQFRSVVNHVFSHHSNPSADRFRLYFDASGETSVVCNWIHKVVGLGIKEFELDFTPSPRKFMLSYDLVNVESIKVMKLVNCELHLPFNSNGLRHLRELTFQSMRARPVAIQAIFLNCVELRSLKLVNCSSVYSLKIPAQDLKGFRTLVVKDCTDVHSISLNTPALYTFHYHGKTCEINFQCNLPQLNDVVLDIPHPRGFQLIPHRKDVMISLAFVRVLTVTSVFLEGLSARFEAYEYREMLFCLWRLKEFHLLVAPESYLHPSDIALFLRKCPRIERVFIELGQNAFGGDSHYWNSHGRKCLSEYNAVFPFLTNVKIKGFTVKELPVVMGRFFLKHAICLRRLVLVRAKNNYVPDVMILDCLRLGIASNAMIQVHDYQMDKSSIIPQHLKGV